MDIEELRNLDARLREAGTLQTAICESAMNPPTAISMRWGALTVEQQRRIIRRRVVASIIFSRRPEWDFPSFRWFHVKNAVVESVA